MYQYEVVYSTYDVDIRTATAWEFDPDEAVWNVGNRMICAEVLSCKQIGHRELGGSE